MGMDGILSIWLCILGSTGQLPHAIATLKPTKYNMCIAIYILFTYLRSYGGIDSKQKECGLKCVKVLIELNADVNSMARDWYMCFPRR